MELKKILVGLENLKVKGNLDTEIKGIFQISHGMAEHKRNSKKLK